MSKKNKRNNEQLSLQKSRSISDPVDTYFHEKISYPIAKAYNHFGLHPNVATVCSLLTGVAGGVLIAFHNLWMNIPGVILIILSIILDCSDGQIARMSGKGSLYGRCFDGFADSIVYASIYVGISVRCMSDKIPFTDMNWSWWIFLISVPVGFYFHVYQARILDYHKNMYMYLTGNSHSELTTSEALKVQIDELPKHSFKKFVCSSYLSYTKSQERLTPNFQKLHQKIIDNGGVVPEKIKEMWAKNTKYSIVISNIMGVNFRTYLLIVLLFLNYTFWIFPVNIIFLEAIKIFVWVKYEKLAKKCLEEGFDEI